VTVWDERFTTVIAAQALIEADVSRSSRKKKIDKVAAAVLLQGYLDSRAAKSNPGGIAADVQASPVPALPVFVKDTNRSKGRRRGGYR
jgi:hypothetical protein